MKAISIRQPWAGAVALGWKDVENRSRMISHRGLFLVHAGQQFAPAYPEAAHTIEQISGKQLPGAWGMPGESSAWAFGAIVGVVELRAAHRGCDGSCSLWAQLGQVHHLLTHVGVLQRPIPCAGRLYPWTPEPEVLDLVKEVWPR